MLDASHKDPMTRSNPAKLWRERQERETKRLVKSQEREIKRLVKCHERKIKLERQKALVADRRGYVDLIAQYLAQIAPRGLRVFDFVQRLIADHSDEAQPARCSIELLVGRWALQDRTARLAARQLVHYFAVYKDHLPCGLVLCRRSNWVWVACKPDEVREPSPEEIQRAARETLKARGLVLAKYMSEIDPQAHGLTCRQLLRRLFPVQPSDGLDDVRKALEALTETGLCNGRRGRMQTGHAMATLVGVPLDDWSIQRVGIDGESNSLLWASLRIGDRPNQPKQLT